MIEIRSLVAVLTLPVIAGLTALSCSRPDPGGAAGSQPEPVASIAPSNLPVELPTLSPSFPSASVEPLADAAPAASVREADAGATDDKSPVRLGSMTVTGALSQEVIGKTIRAQMPKVRQCYDKALASSPGQKGQLKVRLAIDREGAVTTAGNGGTDLQNEELVGCVLRAFWSMKFPQPKDGIVLIVLPLRFGVQ